MSAHVHLFECRFKLRIVNRNQRSFTQLPGKEREPQTTKTNQRDHVQPDPCVTGKRRHQHPQKIHHTHHEDHYRNYHELARIPFDAPRQQEQERRREMEYSDRDDKRAPAAVYALELPADLFRKIAGPDDQILRKREVRPEHDESQQQFPKIMKVQWRDNSLHRFFA